MGLQLQRRKALAELVVAAQVEQLAGLQHMRVRAGQQYQSPGEAYVEGDASSASYFLAGVSAG